MWAHIFWSRDPKHIGLHHKFLKTFRFLDKPRSCVANVGHVGNIFAYRCFLFAVPMLRVCRAAPLKTRFRSQDIITALPMTSWEPPTHRKVGHLGPFEPFCLPVKCKEAKGDCLDCPDCVQVVQVVRIVQVSGLFVSVYLCVCVSVYV